MNDDRNLKNIYKDTFTEIHAPEALARKVKNMSKSEKKFGLSTMKRFAVAAGIGAILFAGSNGISYAATGNTWLKTFVVRMNGDSYEVDLEAEVEEDGSVSYSYTTTVDESDGPVEISITDETPFTESYYDGGGLDK